MTKKTNAPLRAYFYLDVRGIESLYAQTTERVETELVETHKKTKQEKIDMKLGLGRLIGALFGLDVGVTTGFEALQGRIEESKSQLTVENKLSRLIAYLGERGDEYFEELPNAAAKVSQTQQKAYIRVADLFDAPQFYSHGPGAADVNGSRAVLFVKKPPEYDPSDSYFKNDPNSFVMSAGIDNLTRLRGGMGATSHEALFFRGLLGRRIPLYLFGVLMHLDNLNFQIKPFAIEVQGGLR
jgi:hypothetical protein